MLGYLDENNHVCCVLCPVIIRIFHLKLYSTGINFYKASDVYVFWSGFAVLMQNYIPGMYIAQIFP